MIYKFKSKAAGDVIMLGPNGDQLLRLLGREPAAQGIFEPPAMPSMLATLRAAVATDDQARAARRHGSDGATSAGPDPDADTSTDPRADAGITLRQRVWPMVEMLTRAEAAGQPVVWGT